jgi:hypothetical protein
MNKQQKFIAMLIAKATATRNMIAEAQTVLAETEKQIAEECAEFIEAEGMLAAHLIPGFTDCELDWSMVTRALAAIRARAEQKKKEVA